MSNFYPEDLDLEPECGVTDISLRNGEKLIKKFGCPTTVSGIKNGSEYVLHIGWNESPIGFNLTGFSWGYNGTGSNGLVKFLTSCGFDINIDKVASMDSKIGFKLGE